MYLVLSSKIFLTGSCCHLQFQVKGQLVRANHVYIYQQSWPSAFEINANSNLYQLVIRLVVEIGTAVSL